MIDLHIHMDGSLEPEDMLAFAESSGVELPTYNREELRGLMSVKPECTSLVEYLQKFNLPLMAMQTEQVLHDAAYRVVGKLSRQGLCYAEIRFAPQFHRRRGLTQQQVVEAAVAGLKEGIRDFHMPAQLILCCMRGSDNHEENMETLRVAKKFLGKGVCCVDLAGDEAGHPNEEFEDIFRLAKEQGIPYILHSGEAAGSENVASAIRMGALRIGHGIHAAQDPAVVKKLAETKIPLETCYTSNLNTKCINAPEKYPLKRFVEEGVVVTLATDNMAVSNTTLQKEYLRVQQLYGFTTEQMKQFARNAVEAALLPEAEKAKLRKVVEMEFGWWLMETT